MGKAGWRPSQPYKTMTLRIRSSALRLRSEASPSARPDLLPAERRRETGQAHAARLMIFWSDGATPPVPPERHSPASVFPPLKGKTYNFCHFACSFLKTCHGAGFSHARVPRLSEVSVSPKPRAKDRRSSAATVLFHATECLPAGQIANRLRCGTGAEAPALLCTQFRAASVMAWVQAPSGAMVITGSEPPDKSDCTVRS